MHGRLVCELGERSHSLQLVSGGMVEQHVNSSQLLGLLAGLLLQRRGVFVH